MRAHQQNAGTERSEDDSDSEPPMSQVLPRGKPRNNLPKLPPTFSMQNPLSGASNVVPEVRNLQPDASIPSPSLDPMKLLQAILQIVAAIPDLMRCPQGKVFDDRYAQFMTLINNTLMSSLQNAQNGGRGAPH